MKRIYTEGKKRNILRRRGAFGSILYIFENCETVRALLLLLCVNVF